MTVAEMFEKHHDEFLKFERIQPERRMSDRRDLHAFLVLARLVPGTNDIVSGAEHDEIYLDINTADLKGITEEQVIDLVRCGVRCDSDGCLCMFV